MNRSEIIAQIIENRNEETEYQSFWTDETIEEFENSETYEWLQLAEEAVRS